MALLIKYVKNPHSHLWSFRNYSTFLVCNSNEILDNTYIFITAVGINLKQSLQYFSFV